MDGAGFGIHRSLVAGARRHDFASNHSGYSVGARGELIHGNSETKLLRAGQNFSGYGQFLPVFGASVGSNEANKLPIFVVLRTPQNQSSRMQPITNQSLAAN